MLRAACLILACVVLPNECSVVKKDGDGCQKLVECSIPLQTFIIENEETPTDSEFETERVLDELCRIANEQRECVEEYVSQCDTESVNQQVAGVFSVANDLCSEEGRQALQAVSGSACVTDVQLQDELVNELQSCVQQFEFDVLLHIYTADSQDLDLEPQEICPYAEGLLQCTDTVARDKCGDAYADFNTVLVRDAVGPELRELGCSADEDEEADRSVLRANKSVLRTLLKKAVRATRAVVRTPVIKRRFISRRMI